MEYHADFYLRVIKDCEDEEQEFFAQHANHLDNPAFQDPHQTGPLSPSTFQELSTTGERIAADYETDPLSTPATYEVSDSEQNDDELQEHHDS